MKILFLAAVFLVSCKVSKRPELEVQKQEFKCSSSLCRTVSEPDKCKAMEGVWSEERKECLTSEEYEKWQCIINSKKWNEEEKKCGDTGEESPEKPAIKDDYKDAFPEDKSVEKTDVNVEVEVVE